MKYFLPLTMLVFLGACSSSKTTSDIDKADKVSNASFKKEKPLAFGANSDYYSRQEIQAENPGLMDETIDRLNLDELEKLDTKGDEILDLAITCAKGKVKDSSKQIDALYQKYQNYPSYWTQVANCYLKQDQSRKAVLYYNKALELSASYAPALNNIGVLYFNQGQVQKALVAFERANQSSRFAKTPRLNLAKIYLSYGLAEQAKPILNGLLTQSPNDTDLIIALGNVYFIEGQYQESLKYFFRTDQKAWVDPTIGLNISYALFKLNKKKDATDLFKKIDKPKHVSLIKKYEEVRSLIGE